LNKWVKTPLKKGQIRVYMSNRRENRRKSPDKWVLVVRSLSIVSWLLFIFALVMSYYAAPEKDYGLVRYHNLEIRKFWLVPLTGYLYAALWLSALISYFSLIVHKFRSRRQTDSKNFNLLLLMIVSVAWAVYILINLNQ